MVKKKQQEDKTKRGEDTRQALIQAGMKLFGEYGLEATSTRLLADKAAVNIAAIQYHFGSKEGLYQAVINHIIERISVQVGKQVAAVETALQQQSLNKTEAKSMLIQLVDDMAMVFVDSTEPKSWVQLIMREQANPTEAFDSFYDGYMKQILVVFAWLLAAITGLDSDSDVIKIRVHILLGQLLGFVVSREALLRRLGVDKLSEVQINSIHQMLQLHVEAVIDV